MPFTVHEVSRYFSTVMPEAASLADSFLSLASPTTANSAPLPRAAGSFGSSDQMRNPNDLMRALSRFSATCEFCAGASVFSPRTLMVTEIFGSPLLRMKSMRSSRDSWLSDFCTSRTLTAACVVTYMSPSLLRCGSPSCTMLAM